MLLLCVSYLRALCLLFFRKKIKERPANTTFFIQSRYDLGAIAALCYYAKRWQQTRGPVTLILMTYEIEMNKTLASIICPEVEMIYWNITILKKLGRLYEESLMRIYANLSCVYPNLIFIWELPFRGKNEISRYRPFLDSIYKQYSPQMPELFNQAYLQARSILDYQNECYNDLIALHYQKDEKPVRSSSKEFEQTLGIQRPYILINVNIKNYHNLYRNYRSIKDLTPYEQIVDYLICKGFDLVIQGRQEQPIFPPRAGLIDYAHSPHVSIENDFRLFSGAAFCIMSKTGPENFSYICGTPILGLNYTELCSMQPNQKFRYYPKTIKENNAIIGWEKTLKHSSFFQIGRLNVSEGLVYEEMSFKEMKEAVDEFLLLLDCPYPDWLNYTAHQQKFRNCLCPMHLDLYQIRGVPCDAYLKKYHEKIGE